MRTEKRILVLGLNDVIKTINDTPINRIISNKNFMFDPEDQQVIFKYKDYTGSIGPSAVFLDRPNSNRTGTDYTGTNKGRQLRIIDENTSINISRLYILCREIALGRLCIHEIDDYVLNHKDNKGTEESMIEGNIGLDVTNYELVSSRDNTIHGEAWNRAKKLFGLELKFSALDKDIISMINMSGDRKQFLLHMRVQRLNFKDYEIEED